MFWKGSVVPYAEGKILQARVKWGPNLRRESGVGAERRKKMTHFNYWRNN
jgi:hypothetical protein